MVRYSSIIKNIFRRIFFLFQRARTVVYSLASSDVEIEGKPIRNQPLLITGAGKIRFSGKVAIGYFPSPYFFSTYAHFDLRENNACIEIGDGVVFNNNATLVADGATVSIGPGTMAGLNFTVLTSDAHHLHPDKRSSSDYPREDVRIGRNVFIGNNVTLLKGVTVGSNSVIGNGSVVVHDIPENVIAAGVPCKVIKQINAKHE